ncbi:Cytoplasmic FMR1-interacting protein 2 [Thelohanellus kitauei]|uniref:Cytoplasmic FMR1-interacting protein n=1 Tax=Thelohanellus kitauei TaxID=669202 RepID=A0A0C2IV47_THEKT|nr:Cytoplasmic FMR1-interacting protein 2 [Thelohanellus kitauei]
MKNTINTRITDLEQLDISIDSQEVKSGSISENDAWRYDSNFEDCGSFCLELSRLLQEGMLFRHVNDIIQEGMGVHVSLLYNWRSISTSFCAIPVDENHQNDFIQSQFCVLIEPMKKLYTLSKFIDQTLVQLVEIVDKCLQQLVVKIPISEGMLESIGKLIHMLMIIDNIRSSNPSIRHDFSVFKKAHIIVQDKQESEQAAKISQLTIYTSQPLEIIRQLKTLLSFDPRRYKVIREVLKLHGNVLENQRFYDPHKGSQLILILLGCLTVLDQQKSLGNKLAKHKISFARLDKIFQETPAIALVGDTICQVRDLLKITNVNFDFGLLDPCFIIKNESTFDIVAKIPEFRNEYLGVMSELLLSLNSSNIVDTHSGLFDISLEDAKNLYQVSTKALKVIRNWSFTVQRLFFCRISNSYSPLMFNDRADNVSDYSLLIRYNYSQAEKNSISQVIFMIKSMFNFIKGRENLIVSAINNHIYNIFQNFVQSTIIPLHLKIQTCKCEVFRTRINIIKNICTEEFDVVDFKESKIMKRIYNLHQRSTSALSTKFYLARTILEVVLQMKETKKYIDNAFVSQIQAFLNEISMFSEIMNFSKCLDQCTRLDTLWFKDFYIDLSVDEPLQNPFDDTITWIIISHLLKARQPNDSEFTLYLIGIYIDAADSILNKLKVSHLNEQVLSEADFVFKQLCNHLAILIYSRRRAETFNHSIDKSYKNKICQKLTVSDKKYITETEIKFPKLRHFSNLCKQLSTRFLGGRIKFHALLCERLHHSIKESLRYCIKYYENQNIHSVILLSSLIDTYQEIHVNISEDFLLPPFEVIYREVNQDMEGCLPQITHQIIKYLVNDLAQNYSFSMVTERFVRCGEVLSTKHTSTPVSFDMMLIYPSKSIMNFFNDQHSYYSQFVGIEHFMEIYKLVGHSGFGAIVDEIKKCISNLIPSSIKNSVVKLLDIMPSSAQFPPITNGFTNVMDFFSMSLYKFSISEQIHSEILHSFRILGNYIVMVYMLEKAMYSHEAHELFLSAPFDGFFTIELNQNSLVETSSYKHEFIKSYTFDKFPQDSIPQHLKDALDQAKELDRGRMNNCISIYVSIIDHVREQLTDTFWTDKYPWIDVVSEGSRELNRVFSAIFYYISLCGLNQELSAQYLFGDGVIYGLIFLIVCLGLEDWVEVSDICSHAISAFEHDLMNKNKEELDSIEEKAIINNSSNLMNGGDVTGPYAETIASMRVVISKRRQILKFFSDKLSRRTPSKPESLISIPPPKFVPKK